MFRKIATSLLLIILAANISFAAKIIPLPTPKTSSQTSIEQTIYYRRTVRDFQENQLTKEQLSQLLWAAQGITDTEFGFRAAPSAGALYPLSLYIANQDGIFRYMPDGHKLLQLSDVDKRPSLKRASLGQSAVKEAPVVIIVAANFNITQAKYGARAFRYVCMEIGHVAENIHLQAIAMGLASIPIGAFWDDVIKSTLELPDTQHPLYLIPIGYEKK